MSDLFPRSSGVLLHPTSLPGPYGIGDLGEWAYRFVDWLVERGQSIWQVLPLSPTGYGDSPYQALSAFAGNPLMISLDRLVEAGWLDRGELYDVPRFPADRVDFGKVIAYHSEKLARAYEGFRERATGDQTAEYERWVQDNAYWLADYTLFAALKARHNNQPWVEWPRGEALHEAGALREAEEVLADAVGQRRWQQWAFHRQWGDLKRYAGEKGVRLIGDLPIFVAHDSADVWANRDLFYLDEKGYPTVVAGVPPDYFSPTGQRWGNPLYRWDVLKASGYGWWLRRFRALFNVVDAVRVDHFRGFAAYWEIPAEEETAEKGEWIEGPGEDFFRVVKEALGELPIIAEDLGVITKDVVDLREGFDLPGMKVLQFAWSGPKNPFLPHNHTPNSVVYTGTHDNNTTHGWWQREADEGTRNFIRHYLHRAVDNPAWTLIVVGMRSVANTFVVPMQDVLNLGAEARMNTPGQPGGNWTWRFTPGQLDYQAMPTLAELTELYQRRPDQQEVEYGDVAVKNDG
jgi:4-alpha-glucanotransferase